MDWKDIAKDISEFAPGIGAALASFTGGTSAVVGAAIGALAGMVGKKPEDTKPEDIINMISDPEAKAKFMQAENAYLLEVRKIDQLEFEAKLKDTANARDRQAAHEKATGKSDVNLYILAWVIMFGFLGGIIALVILRFLFPTVQLANDPLITLLLGALSTDAGLVVGYFFGSSKDQTESTRLLSQAPPVK